MSSCRRPVAGKLETRGSRPKPGCSATVPRSTSLPRLIVHCESSTAIDGRNYA